MIRLVNVRSYEMGLHFCNGEFKGILRPGLHWFVNPLGKTQVDVVSQRDPWLVHEKLDLIVKSGKLTDRAIVIDLKDNQRGLVWVDGRFQRILGPGLYAYWTGVRTVRIETIDSHEVRLQHKDLKAVLCAPETCRVLDTCVINRYSCGVLYVDGEFVATVGPGKYAFWRDTAEAKLVEVDLREILADVSGQDVMTSDKVSLRLNVVVTYRIVDARRAVTATEDVRQAIYRETQLAVRAVVGGRELDAFLVDKGIVAEEINQSIRERATELGLEIVSVGIRDIILPGDMKDLMNKVTDAKKVAEANLIVRREETAAMRSQVNTARLLADNPTLMRMRELEVLERIASTGKLNIMLGEKGLADRIVNLL
ncbi:MAG: slipin family protein [Planctomycetota bacterium]|nr:slipin family protein [Planctomycetota bacterium]